MAAAPPALQIDYNGREFSDLRGLTPLGMAA